MTLLISPEMMGKLIQYWGEMYLETHVGDGIYPPLHPVVCNPHLTHLTQTARSSLCTR